MWILPSRGRPHNVARFFEHWQKTESTTEGLLVVDEDDHPEEYAKLNFPEGWRMVVYPRLSMCGKSNRAFHENPGKEWYGFVDDDAVPQTMHWDRRLVEAAGRDGLSHCWNGIGNERLASQFVIGGDFARELGWMFYPGLSRIYGDDIITALADDRGVRKYLGDVRLEQMHFSNGKANVDASYLKPEAAEDRRVFEEWQLSRTKPVTIIFLKAGSAYSSEYVNILRDMVSRNLARGFPGKFVCITDDPEGIDESIEILPLPADLETWWGKLYMFKRGLFADGTRCVFMDLDTIIVDEIDDILRYDGQFATLIDFYYPHQVGPAIIAWEAGDYAASIWDEWLVEGKPKTGHGDLWWINQLDQGRFAHRIDKLQNLYPGKIVSYKAHCWPYPPEKAAIVCFHGQPKPDNCCQEWVANVWRRGGQSANELKEIANTSHEVVRNNVLSACKRDLPWLSIKQPHDKQCVIVGGGPSIKDTINEVKWRKSQGQTVISINGSTEFLNRYGVRSDIQVLIDARPENASFVNEWDSRERFIASQCAPSVFDKSGGNTTVFHMNTVGIQDILPKDREANLISSGTTVGLAAIVVAYTQGYRAIHLHGFDSSYEETHHAYEQKQNDNDMVVEVVCAGKTFKAAPWMVKQAQQFQELALQLIEDKVIITVAGSGLLPHLAHQMSKGE